MTREQLATFLYHYSEYKGYDMPVSGVLDRFTDQDEISEWAQEAMTRVIGSGLIQGKPGDILDPRGITTRAEFAAMLHRFIEK